MERFVPAAACWRCWTLVAPASPVQETKSPLPKGFVWQRTASAAQLNFTAAGLDRWLVCWKHIQWPSLGYPYSETVMVRRQYDTTVNSDRVSYPSFPLTIVVVRDICHPSSLALLESTSMGYYTRNTESEP
ncbi:hypothetical protein B0T24DRAFT_598255 [Lasiosphaeria ovina]|uniref:Uncharacterized protein n=1 Tax=Lasiosphaeria ovina TaxID=92902 RepID=A0AAE0MZA0_9PEZI|nr:hypothetical protein B0T24DRAFT_598255 [Lasiosphaeria ovina]